VSELPPDEPAPGVEVDISAAGEDRRLLPDAALEVEMDEDEWQAIEHGLDLTNPERTPTADGPDGEGTTVITLRVAPALARSFAEEWPGGAVERQRDGSALVRLTAQTAQLDTLLPWLLRLGPRAEILSPHSFKLAMADGAADLALRHRAPPEPV
jgi:predicted DNA-binding transcriptional regulator YafY